MTINPAQEMVEAVKGYVKKREAALLKRIEELENKPAPVIEIPAPLQGEKGDKGDKGDKGEPAPVVSADDVAKAMEGIFHKWALDFERKADAVLEKAVSKLVQPKDGAPGRDAFEVKDFDISIGEDGRTVTVALGEVSKSVKISSILDRGFFKIGEAYEKGDGVTFGGSYWICQKDAPDGKPGDGESPDWRLAARKGRDANPVVKTEKKIGKVKI